VEFILMPREAVASVWTVPPVRVDPSMVDPEVSAPLMVTLPVDASTTMVPTPEAS
jgi:hypothetical protein